MRVQAFPGGKPPGAVAGRHLKAAINRRTPDPVSMTALNAGVIPAAEISESTARVCPAFFVVFAVRFFRASGLAVTAIFR
jgi:hypothetical protein